MGYGLHRARIEQNLAVAHRAVFRAREAAEQDGDVGLEEDLYGIERELTRLAERSLKGRGNLLRSQRDDQQTLC